MSLTALEKELKDAEQGASFAAQEDATNAVTARASIAWGLGDHLNAIHRIDRELVQLAELGSGPSVDQVRQPRLAIRSQSVTAVRGLAVQLAAVPAPFLDECLHNAAVAIHEYFAGSLGPLFGAAVSARVAWLRKLMAGAVDLEAPLDLHRAPIEN